MAVTENDLIVGPLVPASGVTVISLDFYFEREEWLEVYKSGSELPLVLGVDYTVLGGGTDTGSISLTNSANGSDAYSVFLAVPLERSSDMQLRGEFKSGPFNLEMDRLWQRLQLHWTHIQRTVRLSATSMTSGVLAAVLPGQYLKMRDDGTGFVGADAQLVVSKVDAWFQNRDVTAATQAALLTDGSVVSMNGISYKVDSTAVGDDSATNDIGVNGLVPHGLVYPAHFGALGGNNDDTDAINACWAHRDTSHVVMIGDYSATNLIIPHKEIHIELHGKITRLSGGDDYYLVASERHLENVTQAQKPCRITGRGTLDANGNCDHALITQNWNSYFELTTTGANKSGTLFTAETRDGQTFPSSSLVNTTFRLVSHNNGGCGLFVQDSARNNATDGIILSGSRFYGNGDFGVYIEPGAGWKVECQTYGNTVGGVGFNGTGKGTMVCNSFIDDGDLSTVAAGVESGCTKSCAIWVRNHLSYGSAPLIVGNQIEGPVVDQCLGDTSPNGLTSSGNNFKGDHGYIRHEYFGSSRVIKSSNDTFETDDPFRHHNGASTGVFVVGSASLNHSSQGFEISGSFNATNKNYTRMAAVRGQALIATNKKKIGSVSNGGAFSFDLDIGPIPNYDTLYVEIHLTLRLNHNGGVDTHYKGRAAITTKVNGADGWAVALLDEANTPAKWTTAIDVSVSDSGDGYGVLTVSGDPATASTYGALTCVII